MAGREWLRHRGPHRAALAGALGLLGIVAVVGRLNMITGYRHHWITALNLFGFLGSGYCLILFRHAFLPIGRRVRAIVLITVVATGVLIISVQLPSGANTRFTSFQYAVVVMFFVVWGLCIGEPALRFWRAGRGRPRVQRARLRSLSMGYGAILAILAFALSTGLHGVHPVAQLITQIVVIASIPLLHASFAPPEWLRTLWRREGEESLRSAMDDLITFSADASVLSQKALEAGLKVVGSGRGYIALPRSGVIAARGLTDAEAGALFEQIPPESRAIIRRLDEEPRRYAIVIPLVTYEGVGSFTVVSSSFTPLFGSDEIASLEHFVASIGLSLDRFELARQVAERELMYDSLLTAQGDLGEGVAIFDTVEGKVVWVNSAAATIYGYTSDEMLAMPDYSFLVPPEERERAHARRERWNNGEGFPQRYELIGMKKDGSHIHLEASSKVLDDLRAITVFRDITARKRTEQAMVDAYERERAAAQSLRQLDEMKNIFLSAVSHDLRTPLTSVLGIARTLVVHGAQLSQEETRDLISRIAHSAERLEGMLLNLLDVDRLTRGVLQARRTPTGMDTLVERTMESLEVRSHRVEIDCDGVTFPVDAGQVERIIENLVINASRHAGPDTLIKVRVRRQVAAVLLEVEDEGPGVPDHLKEVIFEPFRQGDGPQVSGTGVGLALVAQFAKLHGGKAWVEDAPGGGALFKVLLAAAGAPGPDRPKRAMGGTGKAALMKRAGRRPATGERDAPGSLAGKHPGGRPDGSEETRA